MPRGKCRVPAVVALLLAFAFLCGCGPGTTDTSVSAPAGSEDTDKVRVDLTIWSGQYEQAFKKVGRDYEKLHPEVRVVVETVPSNFYQAWQQTQLVGGTAPAIMQSHWGNLWGKSGLIICWDDYIDNPNPYTGTVWKDLFYTENVDYLRDEAGRAFMLPYDLVFTGIYYNKTIFERLGIDRIPRTWSEWFRDMDTSRRAGIIPLAWPGAEGPQLEWVCRMLFDCLCRDKFATVNQRRAHPEETYPPLTDPTHGYGEVLDGEEAAIAFSNGIFDPLNNPEFAEMAHQLKRLVPYLQKGFNGADLREVSTLFLTQRAVMMLDGTWNVIPLQEDIAELQPEDQFEVGMFRVPTLTTDDSPLVDAPFRDVGGPGGLKFIVNLKNVDTGSLFAIFKDAPIVKMDGYVPDEQALDELKAYLQPFFEDDLTIDELLERWHTIYSRGTERNIVKWEWDMDLATLEE